MFNWLHDLSDIICLTRCLLGDVAVNLKLVTFKLISRIDIWSISCEITLRWIPQHFRNDKSTLVQLMSSTAWCHQATSHYLNRCWPNSMSQYGITNPHWVNGCSMIHVLCCEISFIRHVSKAKVIMMVADVLVPIWHQDISSHHDDMVWSLTGSYQDCPSITKLTHWGRDKMAAISQTTFSNAFSQMKMFKFQSKFHQNCS